MTVPWEPLYARRDEDGAVQIGLYVGPQHCNSRGILHGGVVATLADNAMGLSYAAQVEGAGGVVTLNLSIDYMSMAQPGEWLVIEPRVVKAGRTFGFVDALIRTDARTVARATGVFSKLEPKS